MVGGGVVVGVVVVVGVFVVVSMSIMGCNGGIRGIYIFKQTHTVGICFIGEAHTARRLYGLDYYGDYI